MPDVFVCVCAPELSWPRRGQQVVHQMSVSSLRVMAVVAVLVIAMNYIIFKFKFIL